ncbi:MAG: FtsX-like permease family protein [Brevinematales bacterium]|nr:FtsX-like permease family protein [Brevinematales bacterium]
MSILIKISQRNLLRHRGKSFVIGLIIFLGAFFMTVGNAIVNGMNKGLEENMVQRFLGNLVIVSTNQIDDNILTGMPKPKKVITGYFKVRDLIVSNDAIEQYFPMGFGYSIVFNPEGDHPLYVMSFGIDFQAYQKMFHSNIFMIEGTLPTNGQKGIIVNNLSRDQFYENGGFWTLPQGQPVVISNLSAKALSNTNKLITKNELILQGANADGGSLDLGVKVSGIFKFQTMNDVWSVINFIDIETFRETFGYTTESDAKIVLNPEQKSLLNANEDDINSMFSDESMFESADIVSKKYDINDIKKQTKKSDTNAAKTDPGSYNIICVKLKNGADTAQTVKKLNEEFKTNGMDARAIPWDKASGQIGMFANIFRMGINGFVTFLFFVAIIIIMNTLSMAALERISEIGMMRAVGARKSFIGGMFLYETFILAFVFGTAGMLIGTLFQRLLRLAQFKADNNMMEIMFGGDYFQPFLDPGTVLLCIIQLLFVTGLSIIYPIIVARKITPLDAISRN